MESLAAAKAARSDREPRGPSTTPAIHTILSLARWPAILALALALVTLETIRLWSLGADSGAGEILYSRIGWYVAGLSMMGSGAVLGPLLAERTGWRGWRGAALTAVSTLAAVAVGAAVFRGLFAADLALVARQSGFASADALLLRDGWFCAMAGMLFGVSERSQHRALAAVQAAKAAELECVEMQRRYVELQLETLEAQLDPGLVFPLLDEIERLYRRDAPAANALLDDFIGYLRAALPRFPGAARTLAEEAAQVDAYLRIQPAARVRNVAVAIDLPGSAGRRPFPPMVLLPLARAANAAGATGIIVSGTQSPATEGEAAVEVMVIAVGADAVPAWSAHDLEGLQQTLTAFFGETIVPRLRVLPVGAAVVLRCPAGRAPRGDGLVAKAGFPAGPAGGSGSTFASRRD